MIKILTKNGVENTNIDGARANFLLAGQSNGVVKGALSEENLFVLTNSELIMNPCELIIRGHRILITEPEYFYTSNPTGQSTVYNLIARVTVVNGEVSFELFLSTGSRTPQTDNLFSTITGDGVYATSLCYFARAGSVNYNLVRQIDSLVGGVKVQQTTGTSTSAVMSQKATTDAINTAIEEALANLPSGGGGVSDVPVQIISGTNGSYELMEISEGVHKARILFRAPSESYCSATTGPIVSANCKNWSTLPIKPTQFSIGYTPLHDAEGYYYYYTERMAQVLDIYVIKNNGFIQIIPDKYDSTYYPEYDYYVELEISSTYAILRVTQCYLY